MGVTIIIILTALQFAAGFGVLTLFRVALKPGLFLPLCVLTGVAVFSFVPFLLQLLFVPITGFTVFFTLCLVTAVLNIQIAQGIKNARAIFSQSRFKIALYEIPFLLIIATIVLISVWRCFYLPPTPRDLTSGAEVIAEYAVKEKTMINSVFTVNLESTNNQFKPPFVISLQIIYKLAGFAFGQIWLSTVFVAFVVFLYHALNATLHRLMSGLLVVAFLAIPEMYAYTFMVLFDYSNAVFFFLSVYFLISFFNSGKANHLAFAGLLMGFATYARSETTAFAVFMLPALAAYARRAKSSFFTAAKQAFIFMAPSVLVYILCITVYVNHYLPVKYNIGGLVNPHLLNLSPLFQRFWAMNTQLIFSETGVAYYGWFIFLFCVLFVAELVFGRKFARDGKNWLFAVLVIYLGLPLLGFVLPLMDLDNTTKRGLFKIMPLMLLYMGNNSLLTSLSARIIRWQTAKSPNGGLQASGGG